jgi:FAD/FMN-containing dehydrogenase
MSDLVSRLQAQLGADVVVRASDADLPRHLSDHAPLLTRAVMPLAVAYPRTTEDVSAILAACYEARTPVTPQGGMTGMAGAALPLNGGVALSLERMRAIEEIDPVSSTMTVQAGVALQTVQERADEAGLMFPLDLGARGSCQIGGNLATNAGGNRVLRYGMARDMVLGLEVVLPDGSVVNGLNKMLKNNAGYDFKNLFIGSEGTLGVITRVVLRLFPKPASGALALCAAPSFEAVVRFLVLARNRLNANLSAFEVMWNDFYRVATSGAARTPLSADHPFYILIESSGGDPESDAIRFQSLVETAFAEGLLLDAVVAQSAKETAELWAIRDASGELDRLFGRPVNFDISIPTAQMADFADDCRARLNESLPGARMLVFGHIADSNIHLSCRGVEDVPPTKLIEGVVYDCVRRWKGSISAEHGVGIGKRDYLHYSRNPGELMLMRRLKAALDPLGLMNPDKVLPPVGA